MKTFYDIIVIGAGPAGMAAALAAAEKNPECAIALIEREERTGGILKQCIHDGFGLIRFQKRLTGPEYADRYYNMLAQKSNIDIAVSAFLIRIRRTKSKGNFQLTFTNPQEGIFNLSCTALISATGCRERTDRQVFIHGDRPSGVFTAGQAQAFINLRGYLPGKRFVILGSGDIGLIMARRLTLETASTGGSVEGVYEVKSEPSGLTRNIVQCLNDYGIPLHLSTTVSRLHGTERLEGVTVSKVNERMQPIAGTERFIPCDALILSVGLIPENDILDGLGLEMDARTKGPQVNQYMETSIPYLFSCGNAVHVNDLVDYVSESGRLAGEQAASLCSRQQEYGVYGKAKEQTNKENSETQITAGESSIPIYADVALLYQTPARIVPDGKHAIFCFRAATRRGRSVLSVRAETEPAQGERALNGNTDKKNWKDDKKGAATENGTVVFTKTYPSLQPPSMERFELDTALLPVNTRRLRLSLKDA